MPSIPKDIKKNISDFNKKNGLNFSLENFINAVKTAKKQAIDDGVEIDDAEIHRAVYKDTIKNLYRRAAIVESISTDPVNVDNNVFDIDLMEGLEYNALAPYRQTKEGKELLVGVPFLEMKESEKFLLIEEGIQEIKENPTLAIIDLYKEGLLRIRDMRSFVDNAMNGNFTKEQVAIGLQYAQALKDVNESRSFWWKLFHPIRNNAEKREADNIETTIATHILAKQTASTKSLLEKGISDKKSIDEAAGPRLDWYKTFSRTYTPLKAAYERLDENIETSIEGEKDASSLEESSISSIDENMLEERTSIIVDLDEKKTEKVSSPVEEKNINAKVISNTK